jgi:type 2 lantibiotic biosynthesis protein LanM
MPIRASTGFETTLGCLVDPGLAGLAVQLGSVPGLADAEAKAICAGARAHITSAALLKVSRILLVELNAARVSGHLHAPDPAARWQEWLSATKQLSFWESLADHYPSLLVRIRAVIGNGCGAALAMGTRFAADRRELARLPGSGPGQLTDVTFGAGDSHNSGQTVAVLRMADGSRVIYKPRSVAVDACLARLVTFVTAAGHEDGSRIRVPAVLSRPGYGWAEHIQHRYCSGEKELRLFYQGIGHWLAIMRMVGGSDLHAENVIACGPVPVVVDCETLFTPHAVATPSGYGQAHDRSAQMIADSALRTGLLPGRGEALGWRGVDSSAVGALPGQQPYLSVPVIVGAGTDEARMGYERRRIEAAGNHPSPEPVLARYWHLVVSGFTEMTARLHDLDEAGELAEPLQAFADCPVRVVVRNTATYMELGRMLWHPASMHDEPAAIEHAARLLAVHAENASAAPGDRAVIDAEIAEIRDGDVPVFITTPRTGLLAGPRGTCHGQAADLISDALHRWRSSDLRMDVQVISGTLVSAYLNEGMMPGDRSVAATQVRLDNLDRRRRQIAASIMRTIRDVAIRADDGTVTWIGPVISPTGWAVRPLSADLYNGLSGVAVAVAAYQFEMSYDRADPVDGLDQLLAGTLSTVRAIEDQDELDMRGAIAIRPGAPGGYVGLASQIWGWLLLGRLHVPGVGTADAISRALVAARQMSAAIEEDDSFDLFRGVAGAIVPLLRLGGWTGDARWTSLACDAGKRLVDAAKTGSTGARWGTSVFPEGIGGTAHGATGIGWALARLAADPAARTTCDEADSFTQIADAAFAFEESLYDTATGCWTDLREPGQITAAWCHGAGGIGIVAADLARIDGGRWTEVLARAAACSWAHGLGHNHTLCHGDLGIWEVISLALSAGAQPRGVEPGALAARIISGLGEHGPVSGLARDTLHPALLPGIGGMAYQLLRMHPDSPLPSVLLPDPGPQADL